MDQSRSPSGISALSAARQRGEISLQYRLILLAVMTIAGFVGMIIGAAMMHVLNPPEVQSVLRAPQQSSAPDSGSARLVSPDASSPNPAGANLQSQRPHDASRISPGLNTQDPARSTLTQSAPGSTRSRATPYLYILGVTQDAGYPQAGCYQPHCLPGWQTPGGQRGAVSLGLVTSSNKYLFEATPNLPSQLYALEREAPSASHPLSGVFVTHAHIGHYTGLMFFGHEAMGVNELPVYAMPRMYDFLKNNGPWSQLVAFNNIALRSLENNREVMVDGVTVTPFEVPHRDEFSETVGFRIAGSQKSAVFIPDINKWSDWSEDLVAVIASTDYALIDAAFFADGELPGRDMSKIPHPFVSETMALLDTLDQSDRDKVWFIHMNHTNPLLRADSEETQLVEAAGYHVAREGVRLDLP